MAEIKRVTLHPLKTDGSIDENVNLYPKTLTTGIVDENGNAVNFPDDSTLVHNTGNENIDGIKTFTNPIRLKKDLCSANLRFQTENNVDELHLVTYSNDVQTDIVFPAGIDDRVELATKDDCGTKLYRHYLGYLEPISGYHGYFYFITRSNESITSIIDLENQLRDFIWPQTIIMLDDSNYNRYIAGIYCDFNGSMYITNARNDGISVVIQSITFNQDIIQPL